MTWLLTLSLSALLMHPVHETVAEVEWNAKSSRLEVALRLSLLDEQWIGRRATKEAQIGQWTTKYLQSHFLIADTPRDDIPRSDKQSTSKYHWVGREEQGSHVWWYFEIEPANAKPPVQITQRMLFERNDGYVNRVVIFEKKKRHAVTLTKLKPTARIR